MAKKLPPTAKAQAKSTDKPTAKKGRSVLIIVSVFFILILLASIGFVAGIYLKFIDLSQLAQNMKLYNYPVIGQYFPQPATNFPKVTLPPSTAAQSPAALAANAAAGATPGVTMPGATPAAVTPPPTGSEQAKLLQQAQEKNKNISKLARLYSGMKPQDAENVLNLLDDNTVVEILNKMDEDQAAKILALFDPHRAARLTQNILKGQDTINL